MARLTQGAFGAGILSEGMYSRADIAKFKTGLTDAVNVFLRPQGGISNRAGLETVTAFDTSGASARQHLIPFSYSTDQTYQLEFTDGVFRVLKDGGYVINTAVAAKSVASVTTAATAEIVMTTAGDTAFFPAGNLVFLRDPNGTHKLRETTLQVVSAAAGKITFKVFDGTTLDTTGAWGAIGAGATLELVYQQTHSISLSDMPRVRFAQDADTMYLAHELYSPMKIARAAHDTWTITTVVFEPGIDPIPETTATISGATVADPVVITATAHGYEDGDGVQIDDVVGMTQVNERTYVVTNKTTNTFELYEPDGTSVDGTAYTAYASAGTTTSPGAAATQGPDVDPLVLTTYTYAVAPVAAETYEEGLPSSDFAIENDMLFKGSVNHLAWRAHPTAERYNVYRQSAGTFGYIGTTVSTTFDDENITADTARGVRLDRNPFDGAGNYPAIVAFYEQRLAFGATLSDPQLTEMSRTDNIENFGASYPSLPDDAFRFRIRARQVNRIRAFVPHASFAILTSGGEWVIAPQGDGEYLRPDKRRLSPMSYYGAADIEPVLIGEVALYVEPSGNVIRDFRLGARDQPPGDLTVLSRDLFAGKTVTSWAYCAAPDGTLWVALDDGTLLTMTYVPEHDVWGWTRHEVGGTDVKVLQVSAIREGARDVPYLVVSRTLGGGTVVMTERLAERVDADVELGYFVDGGRQASYATAQSEITGLLHLRGETVTALVGGDVVDAVVVDATGTAAFGAESGKNISAGLLYSARAETLPIVFDTQERGSTEGSFKGVAEVAVKLEKTRGAEIGTSLARMTSIKEWEPPMVGGPIPLKTSTEVIPNDGDWERDASVIVRQRHPLPMTVTGITPDWEVGD